MRLTRAFDNIDDAVFALLVLWAGEDLPRSGDISPQLEIGTVGPTSRAEPEQLTPSMLAFFELRRAFNQVVDWSVRDLGEPAFRVWFDFRIGRTGGLSARANQRRLREDAKIEAGLCESGAYEGGQHVDPMYWYRPSCPTSLGRYTAKECAWMHQQRTGEKINTKQVTSWVRSVDHRLMKVLSRKGWMK